MTAEISKVGLGQLAIELTGENDANNAGLGSVLNPEGVDVIILRSTFYGKTNSTGAANLGIGVTTAAAKATDILNDLSMAAVAGKAYNGHVMQNGAKTEISAPAIWEDDKYVTFTGSADTSGLTGTLYLEYVRVS